MTQKETAVKTVNRLCTRQNRVKQIGTMFLYIDRCYLTFAFSNPPIKSLR
jgi:hypothetical protein